jgi:hypothetical protein
LIHSALSLEEAVVKYPDQAVEKAAAVLSLVKEQFDGFSRHQQLSQRLIEQLQQLNLETKFEVN